MIQRIQSVWLLLVALFEVLTFQLPCFSGSLTVNTTSIDITAQSSILLFLVSALIAIISLSTICLYKKRPLQLRLCLVSIALYLLTVYLYYLQIKTFFKVGPSLWIIIYAAIPFLLVFAVRAIYKDGKLLKESDRLR